MGARMPASMRPPKAPRMEQQAAAMYMVSHSEGKGACGWLGQLVEGEGAAGCVGLGA